MALLSVVRVCVRVTVHVCVRAACTFKTTLHVLSRNFLESACRAFLSVYTALLSVHMALLSVFRIQYRATAYHLSCTALCLIDKSLECHTYM